MLLVKVESLSSLGLLLSEGSSRDPVRSVSPTVWLRGLRGSLCGAKLGGLGSMASLFCNRKVPK